MSGWLLLLDNVYVVHTTTTWPSTIMHSRERYGLTGFVQLLPTQDGSSFSPRPLEDRE